MRGEGERVRERERDRGPGTAVLPGAAGARRVLVVQLGRLGDVLLCSPALRALRAAAPDAAIEFLTRAAFAPVLETNPAVDLVRCYTRLRTEARLVRRGLRGRRWDAVVDFQSTPHSALLTRLSGAPVRVGLDKRFRIGYTERVRRAGPAQYSAAHKLEMLAPLGVDGGSLELSLPLTPDDRAFAEALWRRLGWDDGSPAAALSPVSRRRYKRWPLDRFAAVGDHLSRRFDGRLLITSGPGEADIACRVAARMREPAVWDYGPTTIRQLAAVYERCALWVGLDNGPRHLACAVGTPSVALFRPGQAAAWTNPETPGQAAVEAPPAGDGRRPLDGLRVQLVLDAVDDVLAGAASPDRAGR